MAEEFTARVELRANHVALRVRDLAGALRFYHELIGLPVERTGGPAENPNIYWLTGVQLMRAEGERSAVEGNLDHLALGVDNIEAICARLDAAGFAAETTLRRRSRAEIGRELMMAYYRDPEGNKVELLKYLD